VKVRRLLAWAPALVVVALAAAAIAAVAVENPVVEAGAQRLTTSAMADVTVRQGRTATFRYSMHGGGAAGSDVELSVGSAATGRVMTVHLGRQPVDVQLDQSLRIGLDPGRYVWSVEATDSLGDVRSTSSVAVLTVIGSGSHKVQ
jgi:hypothetical protein